MKRRNFVKKSLLVSLPSVLFLGLVDMAGGADTFSACQCTTTGTFGCTKTCTKNGVAWTCEFSGCSATDPTPPDPEPGVPWAG